MITENFSNKPTHSNNLKSIQSMPTILKEIFKLIEEGNHEELNILLEGNDLADKSIRIALNRAFKNYSSNPNFNIIENFKNSNIQIDTKTSFITGLMYSAIENDLYMANLFINHKCDLNIKDGQNRNALVYAIHSSSNDILEMIKLLIDNGINVNEIDSEGQSPLTLAVIKGHKELIHILLDNGADVDHKVPLDGNTALHYVVSNNKPELINLLLLKKPKLNIKNKKGLTPLQMAFNLSSTDCYQILAKEFNQRESSTNKQDEINSEMYIQGLRITHEANGCLNDNLQNNLNNNSHNSNDLLIEEQNFKEEEESIRNSFHSVSAQSVNNNLAGINYLNFTNLNQNSNMNKMYMPNPINNFNINSNKLAYNNNQSYSNLPNNNININNIPTSINRSVVNNLAQKNSNNQKLQKLQNLQDKRLYSEQFGRSIKDKTFRFPSDQNNQNSTKIEIPFCFQANSEGKLGNNSVKYGRATQLHTFIKIQSTPVLHIDISDDSKQEQFILSSQFEELKIFNSNLLKRASQVENELTNALEENDTLKMEIGKLKEEILNKDKYINGQRLEYTSKELDYNSQIESLQSKLDDKNSNYQLIFNKYEILEKEIFELKSKESFAKAGEVKSDKEISKKEFLEKKFSCLKYDEKYIMKCLQLDILDFQEFTKEQIKKVKSTQEELIKLIQEAVEEVMPDYEVKLYGSHATNLCLQWSDLDVVLIHKRNYNSSNYTALQSLYVNLIEKSWKKQIKLIDSAVVPIIKMTSSEQYNSMHIDISLQDSKHYGLKCVELVKSFIKEYEALEPLIFALKNILKNANLNDPYTGGLSSYGLILMVVSFLQSQQENKKSIKICDGNLGRMFLEFLWYYGLMFDHSKYVIYAYPTNEVMTDKDSMNLLFNMQPSHELIIVDPLSKNNNVARSTYQFVNIKMAFMIGFVVSHEECECGCHYNKIREENNVYNIDHCILKRIFNSVKRFNANSPNS